MDFEDVTGREGVPTCRDDEDDIPANDARGSGSSTYQMRGRNLDVF